MKLGLLSNYVYYCCGIKANQIRPVATLILILSNKFQHSQNLTDVFQ